MKWEIKEGKGGKEERRKGGKEKYGRGRNKENKD